MKVLSVCCLLASASLLNAEEKVPRFRAQDVDSSIEIGYGLAIADVQGDGKPDILLADKTQIVWYENPSWEKHVIAENLTPKDNVCIAARDIDNDGKCEIAVGAEWNPSDTENSGAVFYLIPPHDRKQMWEPVKLHAEPTTHRMKWMKRKNGRFDLIVVPLHGKGNKDGEGEGVKVLAYEKPADPRGEWKMEVVHDSMHKTHNFDIAESVTNASPEIILGGKEGWAQLMDEGHWNIEWSWAPDLGSDLKGVGEIRKGSLGETPYFATIEPMHGNEVVFYTVAQPGGANSEITVSRKVLDGSLEDGHGLACGDLLDLGRDQVIAGWRSMSNKLAPVGIKMYVPNEKGEEWEAYIIDDNTMACEDIALADLNADGRIDIIASGRRTKNVKVYWNETE